MKLECGAHQCGVTATVKNKAVAEASGWHFHGNGYGWICPECFEPERQRAAQQAWDENPDNPADFVEVE